ncbi:MAG: TAXI family TRAP transporter solute-binding subunit, partial [Dehalococcoidia bacterium]|nr:TAXI family TRAP transporter solute-binding subunit [Dehalococcoidia bacterium]
ADLRGKKIAWPVSGHASYSNHGRGIFAQAGLSENDIVSVPAESIAAAGRLLLEGRAEVLFTTPDAAIVKEISDAKGGVRFVPMKDDAKSVETMAKIHPGKITYIPPGRTGVTQPTAAWAFDVYIVAWDKLSDAVTYQVVKTLSEHYDELSPIHPRLKLWTPEAAISGSFSIPVHSGAIKYYKEKGMWTKEIDALQKKLLAGK